MPVPGIPAVSQPVHLARDEWVCASCGVPITEAGGEYRIVHAGGCGVIAGIVKAVRQA